MVWRSRAACRNEDPELFFPIGDTGPAVRQIVDAKAVCDRCPVEAYCLTWALTNGIRHGIWGGMDMEEQERSRRREDRARSRDARHWVVTDADLPDVLTPQRAAAIQRNAQRHSDPVPERVRRLAGAARKRGPKVRSQ
ncbi:MAG: WhiB family transcriptional regulator [Actinobacteria bacterium]|nr:WhiB family transcriptional regulator [Actinomycetota bacterium]MBI3687254.1 WhiB family transcriptional regulator [Actinomycetota bacterium]